ncbi:uncharacterized protein LOC9654649 [Selaginella moellendorffii]|nr:uncharacterized protein LOC9654649 [Selaginella moellendorffii]|eukprot:XP_002983193.2 uncharacterized protein LOC9654649 [Selaginella moellendorffii]
MAMAEEDFGDAELWAAIDSAAAARYGGDRSIVVSSRFQQQQSPPARRHPLVELPPSPQQQPGLGLGYIVPRMAARSDAIAPPSLKRQQSHFPDGHIPVRQKQSSYLGSIVARDAGRPSSSWTNQNENQQPSTTNHNVSPWMPQQEIPSSTVFRQLQDAAMAILEKGDYLMMQGKPFIRKSGWRKIAFFFSISFEIKERKIEYDQNTNVLRAEFVVRASMQSGRFSDGWGSCDLREKRFSKPNHDIPSTAETRAKTRACQDLLGIGEYKSGGNI